MSEGPGPGRSKFAERAAREARLAKALRANLRRRKEQARAQERVSPPGSRGNGRPGRDPPA